MKYEWEEERDASTINAGFTSTTTSAVVQILKKVEEKESFSSSSLVDKLELGELSLILKHFKHFPAEITESVITREEWCLEISILQRPTQGGFTITLSRVTQREHHMKCLSTSI